MIKTVFLDYDIDHIIETDHTTHTGSCIAHQVEEQGAVYDHFGPLPAGITEHNTTIHQLWWEDGEVDYAEFGEQLGMEVVTVSSILQPPGNIIPMHEDTFFKINQQYPDDKRLKVRANIFLTDWQPGHVLHHVGKADRWESPYKWGTGQGFMWDSTHWHLSANVGFHDKYTLQISGFLHDDPYMVTR